MYYPYMQQINEEIDKKPTFGIDFGIPGGDRSVITSDGIPLFSVSHRQITPWHKRFWQRMLYILHLYPRFSDKSIEIRE